MSFFDIEKAYPRVCKSAMWTLLRKRGCDERMVKVCIALHESTTYAVKVAGGVSSEWMPDRGLREGCPSSPTLFNIYHDGVMEDFRARRAKRARDDGNTPGLTWKYKVDGSVVKSARLRKEKSGDRGHGFALEEKEVIIGDIGYADDTAIVGWKTEVRTAERLFLQTLTDWEEKANEGKTERIRITGKEGRMP